LFFGRISLSAISLFSFYINHGPIVTNLAPGEFPKQTIWYTKYLLITDRQTGQTDRRTDGPDRTGSTTRNEERDRDRDSGQDTKNPGVGPETGQQAPD